jgi:hypothetical protein
MNLQSNFDWRKFGKNPHDFLERLEKAKFTKPTAAERKRGIVAHIALEPLNGKQQTDETPRAGGAS